MFTELSILVLLWVALFAFSVKYTYAYAALRSFYMTVCNMTGVAADSSAEHSVKIEPGIIDAFISILVFAP